MGAALLAAFVSIVIGITGGYAGGIVDDVLSLLSNVVLVIPTLPLVIVILAYVKSNGLLPLIIIIALTSWAASARVLRAQTLSVRNREYVLSARAAGERLWRIVFVEIMPNELPIIVSNFIFGMIFAILTQAALAFIGLGDPTLLTWGNMLNIAYSDEALPIGAWWWIIPPGLCIALLGMGLALINFSLDELLNPRLRVYRPGARTDAGRIVSEQSVSEQSVSGEQSVLRAAHVSVEYAGPRPTRAVRDVSFELHRGQMLGIAGESGCGKSTLAYALARLLRPPAELTAGSIQFTGADGEKTDLMALDGEALREFRWRRSRWCSRAR